MYSEACTYAVSWVIWSRKYCTEHLEKTNGLLKVTLVRRCGADAMTCWFVLLQSLRKPSCSAPRLHTQTNIQCYLV